jgi:HlyD family secretion protein
VDFQRDENDLKRQRWMRIGRITLAAAAVLAVFILVRLLVNPSLKLSRIRVETVDRGTVRASIQATGIVKPGDELVLVAPFESRVIRLLAKPGEQVEAETPLLQLDDREIRNRYDRLSDEIALKKNVRERLQIEQEQSRDKMKSEEETRMLRVSYLEAKRKQQEKLQEMGAATPWAVRQATLDEDIARVELEHLLREARRKNESLEKQIEGVEIEIRLLQAEEDELEKNLRDATVVAGVKGVLVWAQEEVGVTVRKGEVVARIANLDWFQVEAKVSDIHSGKIGVGMPAVITTFEDTLAGHVSSIPPSVERGEMTINISLDDPDNRGLRPNLRVDVYIVHDQAHDALRLPKGPALAGGGRQNVFVLHRNEAIRTPVTFGLAGVDGYEVLSGLSEGDEVILSDMRDYQHLERVKLR